MGLSVIDKPGERGSRFFDEHKATAEVHEAFAQEIGGACEGKYGCFLFETEIEIDDADLGRVRISQTKAMESVGATIMRSHYMEFSRVTVPFQKRQDAIIIKKGGLMLRLFGYKKLLYTDLFIKSPQGTMPDAHTSKWLKQNKVARLSYDKNGISLALQKVFTQSSALHELIAFLKKLSGKTER